MTWEGRNVLAVVPARGGSKSIPRKNLAKVGGVSLVARAAQVALQTPWIDRALLSTDDLEIAEEARMNGLETPFMRPDSLAGDLANSKDMWRHAWLAAEQHYRVRFDYSLLLEPTSPLRKPEDLEQTIRAMTDGGHNAAVTVSRTPAHYTPHKTLSIDQEGRVGFYLPQGASHSIRQTIPPYFHRNGICYAVTRDALIEQGTLLEDDCVAVVIERHVVNIDEPLDIRIAELLLGETDREVPHTIPM